MRNIIFLGLLVSMIGCSSPPIRSKWADKNMRVMIDPDSVSVQDYVAIQTALVKEDRFMVVDRAQGLRAIKTEQERLHRREIDRYADNEKWAIWGRLLGVGAVVVGHSQCTRVKPFFNLSSSPYVNRCKQYLSLVDANTGQVIVAIDGISEQPAPANNFGAESFIEPSSWEKVVAEFVDAYPKEYKPQYYSDGLLKYRDEAEEEAKRQKTNDQHERVPSSIGR